MSIVCHANANIHIHVVIFIWHYHSIAYPLPFGYHFNKIEWWINDFHLTMWYTIKSRNIYICDFPVYLFNARSAIFFARLDDCFVCCIGIYAWKVSERDCAATICARKKERAKTRTFQGLAIQTAAILRFLHFNTKSERRQRHIPAM